jgi:hypothetical protein
MKNWRIAVIILSVFIFAGCIKDEIRRTYTFYRPVYRTSEEVRQNIKSSLPISVTNPGKLFYRNGYIFLNEINRGVHIIDISKPSQPKVVAFVNIPGAVDLAVRSNILYSDMYTDLVALDISDPLHTKVTSIVEGVFPERQYVNFMADTGKVIVDWVRVDTTVKSTDEVSRLGLMEDAVFLGSPMAFSSSSAKSNGVGGSMARFALSDDRMYTVDYSNIKVFNTAVAEKPTYVKEIASQSGGIETIYPFSNYLFIGSMTGMFIYDISNKDNPAPMGTFDHARVCDPVISDGNYAYVTLRNGSQCQGFNNQLDVVDVTDVTHPSLVKSFPMTNPHGLSKDGGLLLICDGDDGLRICDAYSASAITTLSVLKMPSTFDVVTLGGIAVVSTIDGLYLVDYSDPKNPVITGSVKILK